MPIITGKPMDFSKIIEWEVIDPLFITNPAMPDLSIFIISDGVSSSANTITGSLNAILLAKVDSSVFMILFLFNSEITCLYISLISSILSF